MQTQLSNKRVLLNVNTVPLGVQPAFTEILVFPVGSMVQLLSFSITLQNSVAIGNREFIFIFNVDKNGATQYFVTVDFPALIPNVTHECRIQKGIQAYSYTALSGTVYHYMPMPDILSCSLVGAITGASIYLVMNGGDAADRWLDDRLTYELYQGE